MGYVSVYHRNKPVCLLEGALTIAVVVAAAISTGEWIQAGAAVFVYTVIAYLLARGIIHSQSVHDDGFLKVTGFFTRLGVCLLWVFTGTYLLALLLDAMFELSFTSEYAQTHILTDGFSFCWMVALASGVRALFFLWYSKKKEGIRSAPYRRVLLVSVFIFSLSFCYASGILPHVTY